nr:hypothetical protein BaRGS_009879 [Batillaria attramentaria]
MAVLLKVREGREQTAAFHVDFGHEPYHGVNFTKTDPILFSRVLLNVGNSYNQVTGKFTAPVSGETGTVNESTHGFDSIWEAGMGVLEMTCLCLVLVIWGIAVVSGLLYMTMLSSEERMELRVDLKDYKNRTAYEKYSSFHLASRMFDYLLRVTGPNGTAGWFFS